MTLLNIPDEQHREENVRNAYAFFNQNIGEVPKPLQLLSVSPGLFNLQNNSIKYFGSHENLSFPLLACIRYLTARHLDFEACIAFNARLHVKQGMQAEEVEKLADNPHMAPLEEKETAMLQFIGKVLKEGIGTEDMELLRDKGWRDADIMDAVSHSLSMIPLGKMIKIFNFF